MFVLAIGLYALSSFALLILEFKKMGYGLILCAQAGFGWAQFGFKQVVASIRSG